MYSTNVYYYTQRQIVVLYSGSSNRRYDIVYAKDLTLNKGVENKIQFQFLNQEQKPVDMTGKTISFRLIKYDGSMVYFSKELTQLLPLTGITQLELDASDIAGVEPQLCYYSLEVVEGNSHLPAFVSPDATARGVVKVIDSVLPGFVSTISVTIPSHAPISNVGVTFHSSVFSTYDNPLFTDMLGMQMSLSSFTGNVTIQGSTIPNGDWYNIHEANAYANATESLYFLCEGYHPYVRVEYANVTTGDVSGLVVR